MRFLLFETYKFPSAEVTAKLDMAALQALLTTTRITYPAADGGAYRMIIRRIDSTDSLATITELLHSAYARLGAMGFNYTAVDQTEEITRKRVAGGTCLVAVEGCELVGTIMFYDPGRSKGCPWYEQPEVAIIGQFGVRPDRQRRGVGASLLREAEMLAICRGAIELALDTSEGADHLIA